MNKAITHLQTAWGASLDNVTINDIRTAIAETKKMDEEHGSFWVSITKGEEEMVLEVHKDLTVIAVFDPPHEIIAFFSNWNEIEEVYQLFLDKKLTRVMTLLEEKQAEQ